MESPPREVEVDENSDMETVYSDIQGEDPYYPETERREVCTTRSGRVVYSVKRLIVELPEPEPEEGVVDDEEEEDDDDSDHSGDSSSEDEADSFVDAENDDDGWNSDEYIPDQKRCKKMQTPDCDELNESQ